ncbi:MAG: hypothetical protein AAAB16_15280 [Pseudomonas sp.]|uniref:hypothetical protein n=1 Tax=Pseudomonas sp. TaxID=306 RepID=UPI0030F08BCF
MAVKNISDWQVCAAVYAMHQLRLAGALTTSPVEAVIEQLMVSTGQPQKVCTRALERAYRHGLVEAGMWFHGGWLTLEGIGLLFLPQ